MANVQDLLGEETLRPSVETKDEAVGQAAGGLDPALGEYDDNVRRDLELQVDALQCQLQELTIKLHQKERATQVINPTKMLMKPWDIPILESRHLRGVEGAGRLAVFLSQVENCSPDPSERQQIVLMRVDAPLALFVQNALKVPMTLLEFKQHITAEPTDQSEERAFDSLNELRYFVQEDPIEFVSRLKCQLALLEVQTEAKDIPKKDKLIKSKLLKGMPRESKERSELYLDDNIFLRRFLDKLDTERLVVLTQQKEKIRAVETVLQHQNLDMAVNQTPANVNQTPASVNQTPANVTSHQGNFIRQDRSPRQWDRREKYCSYCRSTSHSTEECFRKPRPGSCFDCLRTGCRRGKPGCPGRVNMTR